jgi:uracil-DNA glycosylase family 4
MDAQSRAGYLDAMGIQRWVLRTMQVGSRAAVVDEPAEAHVDHGDTDREWDLLQAEVAACTRCVLHESRSRTVFGTGDRRAQWMIIGEAPGADEDRQGEPFVGRAGQLLNEMLLAAGFRREQVYIANMLKCRPPGNRNPLPGEIADCRGFLQRQIRLVQPEIILAVGGVAANSLLQTDARVGELRGRLHHLGEVPVVVTYHPAYLLRSPLEKRKVWQDLQFARRVYRDTVAHRS